MQSSCMALSQTFSFQKKVETEAISGRFKAFLGNKTAALLIIPMRLDTCALLSQTQDFPAPLETNVGTAKWNDITISPGKQSFPSSITRVQSAANLYLQHSYFDCVTSQRRQG